MKTRQYLLPVPASQQDRLRQMDFQTLIQLNDFATAGNLHIVVLPNYNVVVRVLCSHYKVLAVIEQLVLWGIKFEVEVYGGGGDPDVAIRVIHLLSLHDLPISVYHPTSAGCFYSCYRLAQTENGVTHPVKMEGTGLNTMVALTHHYVSILKEDTSVFDRYRADKLGECLLQALAVSSVNETWLAVRFD